jgi:dipeptidyl aminopeptidase/acylaminoacyl peptidase
MRRLRFSLLTFGFLALSTPVLVAEDARQLLPLPVSDGLAALSFSNLPISISPDEDGLIVYQLTDLRRRGGLVAKYLSDSGVPNIGQAADVWLTDVHTGETKNLTEGKGSNWAPVWSPNGRYVAFYSDRSGRAAVWVWERSTRLLRQVAQVVPRPYRWEGGLLRWTSDSRRVLVKVFPEGSDIAKALEEASRGRQNFDRQNPATVRVQVYESLADPERSKSSLSLNTDVMSPDQLSEFAADLALIDVSSGEVQRVARGIVPTDYWLSPTGEAVAFLNAKGFKRVSDFDRPVYDIVVVSFANERAKVVASDVVGATGSDAVTWSPNGRWLSYLSMLDWFIVAIEGGQRRKVTDKDHPVFNLSEQPPFWSPDGQWLYASTTDAVWKVSAVNGVAAEVGRVAGRRILRILARGDGGFWSTDGRHSLVVAARDDETKGTGFYKIDVVSGEAKPLAPEARNISRPLLIEAAKTSNEIYYVAEDASHSPDIWAIRVGESTGIRRITHVNPLFDRYIMGSSRLVEWRGGDGQRLRGALLLPAGYHEGVRYPLVVQVYGGVMLSERNSMFGYASSFNIVVNMQFWATRGYAVLLPDVPLRVGTPMLDIGKAVLPGVDKVVEMGIVDPERVGVMGSSYGGYSTLALITQSTRFKAAISDAGLVNLLSVYGWMPSDPQGPSWQGWAESGQGRMGGTLWQYRERYIENSPVFYLDRVQTPVLIIQGTEDQGARDYHSNELFADLRRLGKEATYLKYYGANHTVLSFSYEERVDVLNRMIAWFDKHLKSENRAKAALAK